MAIIAPVKINGIHNDIDSFSIDWSKVQDKAESVVLAPISGLVTDFS